MKKILLCVLHILFAGLVCAQQQSGNIPCSILNVPKGAEITLPFSGFYLCSGGKNFRIGTDDFSVPDSFNEQNLILVYPVNYFFQGTKQTGAYEIIFSGIAVNEEVFTDKPNGSLIEEGTLIGTASVDSVIVSVRCRNLDPNLVMMAQIPPVYNKNYWYFGTEIFSPKIMKILLFQPVLSDKTLLQFNSTGKNQSLAELAADTEINTNLISFPPQNIVIKTELSAYPHEITKTNNFMSVFDVCTTEFTLNFNETPLNLYFQKGFDVYIADEYKIGEPIYLFLTVIYSYSGELFCYVRDFSLTSPDEIIQKKVNYILAALQKNKNITPDEYESMSELSFPDGAVKEYTRFFYKQGNAPLKENTDNIAETWYDKNGKQILYALWYDKKGLHRTRHLYSYDENERLIQIRYYDAKLENQNGIWRPLQEAWRQMKRTDFSYTIKNGNTITTETEYRYSYNPTKIEPDKITVTERDATGIIRKVQSENAEKTIFEYYEYDTTGNPIVIRFDNGDVAEDKTVMNTYDEHSRLIKSVSVSADGISEIQQYEYDKNGNLSANTTESYRRTYMYDSKERTTESRITEIETGKTVHRECFRYDSQTGRPVLIFEESFSGKEPFYRFWYVEKSISSQWESADSIDLYELLDKLSAE